MQELNMSELDLVGGGTEMSDRTRNTLIVATLISPIIGAVMFLGWYANAE